MCQFRFWKRETETREKRSNLGKAHSTTELEICEGFGGEVGNDRGTLCKREDEIRREQ
jgi:hypothetical protein